MFLDELIPVVKELIQQPIAFTGGFCIENATGRQETGGRGQEGEGRRQEAGGRGKKEGWRGKFNY